MHLNFIRQILLCSSLIHAVTAMPVIALTDAEDSEGSTFTQGNVAVPQSISTFEWSSVSGRSPQGFLESCDFKQDWSSTPVPSRSSIDVSDNSASIWVLEFVGAATTRRVHNSRKVQPSQDHQMFEADALRIMAGVFDVSYQNVYRDGLQLQGSFGADTDVISSFKVKVTTAPPELENVLQLPCDVSVDIIGSTVAVANFGNGRYIFLGLRRVFSNESRYSKSMEVWFTQEPTKTSDSYGEVEVRSMAGEHDKPSKWQFTVNANERKVIGFGQS